MDETESGALSGGVSGAAIGTIIAPGVGTIIGGAIGLAVGGIFGSRQKKARQQAEEEAEQARIRQVMRSFGAQQQRAQTVAAAANRPRSTSQNSESGMIGEALSSGTSPKTTSGTF